MIRFWAAWGAILLALTLFASPLYAHGDNKHGEEKPAAAAPATPGSAATVSQNIDGAATAAPAAEHGEDHDATANEGGGGIIAALRNLHPATVHFPIALLLMAALTELVLVARPGADLRSAVRVMIYGGAAGAVLAALFGWIHTGLWFGGDIGMQIHRWNGTALAVLAIILAILAKRADRSRTALRVGLFVIGAALLVQGYLGGELSGGPNHLGF